ncbi:permease prefix domain 1-containing protein [Paenibacillus xylanexedens]|uniref:permease prefix domain 1-containing protein n=1 Tax=Paenibacillus xylanexedens TaxID=528191 RepID=UPI003D08DE39
MNRLKVYVDEMFAKEVSSIEINEIKEEVLANLEARVLDYVNEGMDEQKAFQLAIEQLPSVDMFVNENRSIYFTRYLTYSIQSILIFLVILWIITIPLRILSEGRSLNTNLLLVSGGFGLLYILYLILKKATKWDAVCRVNHKRSKQIQLKAWIICGLLFVIVLLATNYDLLTNIRKYWFTLSMFNLFYPLIFLAVPCIISRLLSNLGRYEVNHE